MLIPYDVWIELHKAITKTGIEISPVNPVLYVATSNRVNELERAKDQILSRVKRKYRSLSGTLLDHLVESAEKLKDIPTDIRNILLSYTILVMNGRDVHDELVKESLRRIPEFFEVSVNGKLYVATLLSDEELSKVKITHQLREQVKKILLELLRDNNILKVDVDNKSVELLGTIIPAQPEPTARLLYHVGRREEAFKLVTSFIRDVVSSNLSAHVEEVKFNPLDDVEFIAKKYVIKIPPEIKDVIKNSKISVKAKISYMEMKLYNVYAEIDSEIGIVRIPAQDTTLAELHDTVRNAIDAVDIFIRRDMPVIHRIVQEAKKQGYRHYKAGYNTDKGFDISFEREVVVPLAKSTGRINTIVRVVKEWPLTEKVSAKVEVDTGSESVKQAVLSRLKELEKDYAPLTPTVSDSGKTRITISLSSNNLEDASQLLDTITIISRDVEAIMKTVSEEQSQAVTSKLTGENHVALYALLALTGVRNVLNRMSELTGRTITGLRRVIEKYMERNGVRIDPEVIMKEPEKLVDIMIERDIITFNSKLELLISGRRLSDLVKPFKSIASKHDVSVLLEIATKRAIQRYYTVKGRSVVLSLMSSGELSIDTIIRHIEAGAPVEIEVLWARLGGRTVWEQLPIDVKLKELKLLPVEQVVWLEKNDKIPKSRRDYELILEGVCRGDDPSRCTDYVVSTHPDYFGIPRTLRLVEHNGEKWIDAGMYRIQIVKVVEGSARFILEEKLTGRRVLVKANSIRDAVYKAMREEVEEVYQ